MELVINGNRGGNSGPLPFPQKQQVEFGSIGSVVLPANGPGYPVSMRAPPPPPPVPAVVQVGQRSSNGEPSIRGGPSMTPNKSRRYLSMTSPYFALLFSVVRRTACCIFCE